MVGWEEGGGKGNEARGEKGGRGGEGRQERRRRGGEGAGLVRYKFGGKGRSVLPVACAVDASAPDGGRVKALRRIEGDSPPMGAFSLPSNLASLGWCRGSGP